MKANEFVKKFGWSSLKIAVTLPRFYRCKYVIFYSDEIDFKNEFIEKHKEYMFETQEVKRLIESHELVGNFGGIKRAKRILKKSYTSFNTMVSAVWNDKPFQCTIDKLEKAIYDVESCQ